jgi:hypothetical protein
LITAFSIGFVLLGLTGPDDGGGLPEPQWRQLREMPAA